MKKIISSSVIFIATWTNAIYASAPGHVYNHTVTAHNIGMFQYKIAQSVFHAGEQQHTKNAHPHHQKTDLNIYGRAQMYGTMPLYGEYNDDGRSGGDIPAPALNDTWAKLEHINDSVKFDNMAPIGTKAYIATAGINTKSHTSGAMQNTFGIYTGYIHSQQILSDISTDSNGGYLGFSNHTRLGNFTFNITANGGLLDSTINNRQSTNFWLGGAIETAYKINLDSEFTLQPNIYMGYTWIKPDAEPEIKISKFNMFTIAPGIDAIRHVANGWYGTLGVKYIINQTNGGDITFNGTNISELTIGDYFEYGLTLSKNISHLNFVANIGRHDGARYGWFGNVQIKYIF